MQYNASSLLIYGVNVSNILNLDRQAPRLHSSRIARHVFIFDLQSLKQTSYHIIRVFNHTHFDVLCGQSCLHLSDMQRF